jgi:hypothetical protein
MADHGLRRPNFDLDKKYSLITAQVTSSLGRAFMDTSQSRQVITTNVTLY